MSIMFGLPMPAVCIRLSKARPSRSRLAALIAAAAIFALLPGHGQDKPAGPAAAAAPADPQKPADYVGSETCRMCHEDIFNAFQKNPHQAVETDRKRGWET